jgi:hypothetical protein
MADSIDLGSSVGKRVAISGKAIDAKAGAVLMTDRDEVIYLTDLQRWPDEYLDQRVVVEGTLRRGEVYPEATDEDGISSQGMDDSEQWYLEVDSYRLAE